MSRNGSRRGDGRDAGGDRYRPPSPPRRGRSPPGGYDSWRPPNDNRDRARGHDSYRASHRDSGRDSAHRSSPGLGPGPGPGFGSGQDRYRPPQSDFTFHNDKPLHVAPFSFPPVPTRNRRRGDLLRGDGRGGILPPRPGPPRKPGRPRWQPPPHPSERALISAHTFSVEPSQRIFDVSATAKFRNIDELSDDDEAPMDTSHSSPGSPPAKRARNETEPEASDAADAKPKWSNSDPYTVLPCPEEGTRKKKDVVKLIRKARLEDVQPNTEAPPKAENFISLDSSDDEEPAVPPPPPPMSSLPPLPPGLPPRPDLPSRPNLPPRPTRGDDEMMQDYLGAPHMDNEGPLGTRKRFHDDTIKPPEYGQLSKGRGKPSKGRVLAEWAPKTGEDSCPWNTADILQEADPLSRLHKEVAAFYEFARPRAFEQRIRTALVDNLRTAMKRDHRSFATAQVYPFGSFKSGLYLPTADMDIVVCSSSFVNGGLPAFGSTRGFLYKFKTMLISQRVAEPGNIEVIAFARIPLVKFVDKLTGLKVDVSFENLGGVRAVETFEKWKRDYPVLPILVTVVKHFLLMRGLNEPVNGGIGGFSVICLVVSMLQTAPSKQGRGVDDEQHLGRLILDFFELYGCHFQPELNAISLASPVGYILKSKVSSLTYKNKTRISIIDPNNPANDISGGASNTNAILDRFYDAFHDLRDRMRELGEHPEKGGGVLEVILKGNYSSFRLQRKHLKHVHQETIGPCTDDV